MAQEWSRRGWSLPPGRLACAILTADFITESQRRPGRVVVTDLDNVAMPFIRYPAGDIASWSDEACPCGRKLPLLHDLWGRDHAYLQLPGWGRSHSTIFSVILDDAFKAGGYPCSLPWQVIQKSLERVEVLLVKEGRSAVVEDYIRRQVSALHPALRAEFSYVDDISRTPNGKRARFFSELPGA